MGLRENLNRHPKTSTAIGVGLFVVSSALAAWLLTSESASAPMAVQSREWFTADDGATWFADDIRKPSPFQTADGRTAVKAAVYKCRHGKTFVAYMERTNPAASRGGPGGPKDGKGNPYANYVSMSQAGVQVKTPKAGMWIAMGDPAAVKVLTPVCPEGSADGLEPVSP